MGQGKKSAHLVTRSETFECRRLMESDTYVEIIAMDELGTEEDFMAVEQAAYAGCKVIGTIHAGSVKELHEKPILKKWCEKELFERFIFIEKGEDGMRKYKVYNNRWELLC